MNKYKINLFGVFLSTFFCSTITTEKDREIVSNIQEISDQLSEAQAILDSASSIKDQREKQLEVRKRLDRRKMNSAVSNSFGNLIDLLAIRDDCSIVNLFSGDQVFNLCGSFRTSYPLSKTLYRSVRTLSIPKQDGIMFYSRGIDQMYLIPQVYNLLDRTINRFYDDVKLDCTLKLPTEGVFVDHSLLDRSKFTNDLQRKIVLDMYSTFSSCFNKQNNPGFRFTAKKGLGNGKYYSYSDFKGLVNYPYSLFDYYFVLAKHIFKIQQLLPVANPDETELLQRAKEVVVESINNPRLDIDDQDKLALLKVHDKIIEPLKKYLEQIESGIEVLDSSSDSNATSSEVPPPFEAAPTDTPTSSLSKGSSSAALETRADEKASSEKVAQTDEDINPEESEFEILSNVEEVSGDPLKHWMDLRIIDGLSDFIRHLKADSQKKTSAEVLFKVLERMDLNSKFKGLYGTDLYFEILRAFATKNTIRRAKGGYRFAYHLRSDQESKALSKLFTSYLLRRGINDELIDKIKTVGILAFPGSKGIIDLIIKTNQYDLKQIPYLDQLMGRRIDQSSNYEDHFKKPLVIVRPFFCLPVGRQPNYPATAHFYIPPSPWKSYSDQSYHFEREMLIPNSGYGDQPALWNSGYTGPEEAKIVYSNKKQGKQRRHKGQSSGEDKSAVRLTEAENRSEVLEDQANETALDLTFGRGKFGLALAKLPSGKLSVRDRILMGKIIPQIGYAKEVISGDRVKWIWVKPGKIWSPDFPRRTDIASLIKIPALPDINEEKIRAYREHVVSNYHKRRDAFLAYHNPKKKGKHELKKTNLWLPDLSIWFKRPPNEFMLEKFIRQEINKLYQEEIGREEKQNLALVEESEEEYASDYTDLPAIDEEA